MKTLGPIADILGPIADKIGVALGFDGEGPARRIYGLAALGVAALVLTWLILKRK